MAEWTERDYSQIGHPEASSNLFPQLEIIYRKEELVRVWGGSEAQSEGTQANSPDNVGVQVNSGSERASDGENGEKSGLRRVLPGKR